MMMSSVGALTGIVLTGPRVYYSMAHDGLAFRWLGYIHPVHRTPSRAIVAQAIWATVLAATGAYRALFIPRHLHRMAVFRADGGRPVRAAAASGLPPGYRTWGYPVVPLIFIVVSLAIVVNQFASEPLEAADRSRLGRAGAAGLLSLVAMRIVDFHNHYYPPEYVDALKTPASRRVRSPTTPKATRACTTRGTTTSSCRAIATSRTGSACSTSMASTRRCSRSPRRACTSSRPRSRRAGARMINDAFARVVRERGGRFTALATLPLNDPAASVDEFERAMKDLGLPGAMVFSNVNHVALADERFAPLWKKADELGAVIYIHPDRPRRRGGDARLLADAARWIPDGHDARRREAGVQRRRRAASADPLGSDAHGRRDSVSRRAARSRLPGVHGLPRDTSSRPPSEYLQAFYYDTVNFDPRRCASRSTSPARIGSSPAATIRTRSAAFR